MTVTKITIDYDGQPRLVLEGDAAQRFMDRHDAAIRIACMTRLTPAAEAALHMNGLAVSVPDYKVVVNV